MKILVLRLIAVLVVEVSQAADRALLSEFKRRKEDAIVDISLESMKYNGGNDLLLREKERERVVSLFG